MAARKGAAGPGRPASPKSKANTFALNHTTWRTLQASHAARAVAQFARGIRFRGEIRARTRL